MSNSEASTAMHSNVYDTRSTIEIVPEGILSLDYGVLELGRVVGVIENIPLSIRNKGALLVRESKYQVIREKITSSDFVLINGSGAEVARARRPFFIRDTITVLFDGRQIVMRSRLFSLKNRYDLIEHDKTIGILRQKGMFSRAMELESNKEIGLEIRMFMAWLAIRRRRDNSSSNTYAGGADGIS